MVLYSCDPDSHAFGPYYHPDLESSDWVGAGEAARSPLGGGSLDCNSVLDLDIRSPVVVGRQVGTLEVDSPEEEVLSSRIVQEDCEGDVEVVDIRVAHSPRMDWASNLQHS